MSQCELTCLQTERWTPLHFACAEGHEVKVVSLLLEAGAQTEVRDKVRGICEL
jgi:ankyrin repeat protein